MGKGPKSVFIEEKNPPGLYNCGIARFNRISSLLFLGATIGAFLGRSFYNRLKICLKFPFCEN
jgi:hypothetical protein